MFLQELMCLIEFLEVTFSRLRLIDIGMCESGLFTESFIHLLLRGS
jgi:hypothetical protein